MNVAEPIIDGIADRMQGEEIVEQEPPAFRLLQYLESPNIAEDLDDDLLSNIGDKVKREYDIDDQSRSDWKKRNKAAMDLAMQVAEDKTFPWPKAANVKFPLLTTAAIQFAARAYPAIIPNSSLVKGKVIGADKDGEKRNRAARISEHMSYQLTEEMEEWEEDTDKLLHVLPIVGVDFRKTWFDRTLQRNRSERVPADKLVVNYHAKSLKTVPRVTQEIELYPYEVTERMRSGVYRDVDLGLPNDRGNDDDAPHCFLEQHRKLDLDEDGYPEPYIVTVHKDTTKVVRIVANFDEDTVEVDDQGRVIRIQPVEYFTKYGFIPAPDGSFYDVGFGALLNPINESVNTTINQLLDAGTLQNTGGGFIGNGLRLRGGPVRRRIGEYIPVNADGASIRENIVDSPVPQPSAVLFQLLGLLIEAGKDITSVKDIMTGEQQGPNTPATTTLALIEQGQKVFSAIYKRIHRSLKDELKKLYRLNRLYLEPQAYFTVLDEQKAIAQQDYSQGDVDVVPVSDPTMVSDMQKLGRAEFLMQFMGDPGMDPAEIRRRILEAASIDDIDRLMAKGAPPTPPEVIKAEAEAKAKEAQIVKTAAEVRLMQAQIAETLAKAIKAIADAEASEAGPQLQAYKMQLDTLLALAANKEVGDGPDGGRVSGMASQPDDGQVPGVPSGPAVGPDGAMGGGGETGPGSPGILPAPGGLGVPGI